MFKITKKAAYFGKLNTRPESHGDTQVTAVDLPVTILGGKRELDMLLPVAKGRPKWSDRLYTKDGQLELNAEPIVLARKPEGLGVTIYDKGPKSPLKFKDVVAKNITVQLANRHKLSIELTLQIHPDVDKELPRLARLMKQEKEIEIIGLQVDMFSEDEPDEPEAGEQQTLVPETDEEEEEPEEEEEEEEEDNGFDDDEDDEDD